MQGFKAGIEKFSKAAWIYLFAQLLAAAVFQDLFFGRINCRLTD